MNVRAIVARVLDFVRRRRLERELDEEIAAHLEQAEQDYLRAGLSAEEARRAARLSFGGAEQVRAMHREVRGFRPLADVVHDARFGLRSLMKQPAFAAAAVVTLALGIGANTAIFSIVDTIVFRPLPYKNPERLVKICTPTVDDSQCIDNVSMPDFLDIRDQSRAFEQIAADDGHGVDITHHDGSHETVDAALVTVNWLSTLGTQPILGRDFVPEEGQHGHDHVAILSHKYWRRRFGADAQVVGRTLIIDGNRVIVIGVLPQNVLRYGADILKPLVIADYPADRDHRDLDVVGYLRSGVKFDQARAEVEAIGTRLAHEHAATNTSRTFRAAPLDKYYAGIDRRADQGLLLMLGAVGLVLLIACANVANLLLARAATRGRECVIRAALGATRTRLVRQLLVETVLLFLVGGAAGAVTAWLCVDSLVALAVAGGYVPERVAVAVDGRVLAFSLLISLFTGAAFGLVPALQASRVDLNRGLRDSNQALSGGRRRHGTRHLLVVAEVALSLVLLVGFGLMARSVLRLQNVSPGFDPENLVQTLSDGGRSFPEAVAFWRAALERARAMPGVEHAAVTSRPPLYGARSQRFTIEGRASIVEGEEPTAGDILISADYFRTMRIPLIKGRSFTAQDDWTGSPVVIISQRLTRRYFPDEDPLGKRVMLEERAPMSCCSAAGPVEGVWREIVGVVGDIRQASLEEAPAVTLYRPYSQIVEHDMFLIVRARSAPEASFVAAHMRSHLLAADPERDWLESEHVPQVIQASESIRPRRFVLILLGSFAGLALVVAAVGISGVTACAVAARTREIGVRVALGATRRIVLTQVLGETMALAAAGLAVGSLASLVLTRLIARMLFDVSATDALTYLGASASLAAVALLAGYVPARRAASVDPLTALRHE